MHEHSDLRVAFVLLSLLLGCTEKTSTDERSTRETDTASAPETLTYHDDIEPLLATHCTRCHHETGLGSGDFTNVESVETLAEWMLDAMDAGRMPLPTADPACRDYTGSDHLRMSEESKAQFAAWVEGGMVRGESRPASVVVSTDLVDPDVVVPMPEPYTPTFAREDEPGNEYRCFILDPSEVAGRYITAVGPKVGAPEMMHHITMSSVDKADVGPEYLDPQGWDCIDSVVNFESEALFAGWAAGTLPVEYPEGSGVWMDEDTYLVISMHYVSNPDAPGLTDQTEFSFNVADEVDQALVMFPATIDHFVIPAETLDHSSGRSLAGYTFGNAEIISVLPHMHDLGKAYDMRVVHDDGTETCVVNGDFTFDNQINYQFTEPIEVSATDTLSYTCTWDNPGEETIRYGERTDEEMCIFFAMFSGL